MGYDAFLSYSHEADGELAASLQSALQRFNKPWFSPKPFLRVARDEATFGASEELSDAIVEALDASEHLVVLLSPQAARSPWVNQEIAHWLGTKGPERVTFVVTAWGRAHRPGAPAHRDLRDFRWSGEDVPEAMRGVFDEPLAVDLRWAKSPDDWTIESERYRDAIAAIAAGIRGQDKDELLGEIAAMRTRARIITSGALVGAGILAVAVAVTVPSWYFADRAADLASSEQVVAEAEAQAAERARSAAQEMQSEAEAAAVAAETLKEEAEAEAQRIAPDSQASEFMDWIVGQRTADVERLAADSTFNWSADDINVQLVAMENLNDDRLLDFFVFDQTPWMCGSSGCQLQVYLSRESGDYEVALDLFEHRDPLSREAPDGDVRDVIAVKYYVADEPVTSVFRWNGTTYDFSHFEFGCGIQILQSCEPVVIEPLSTGTGELSLRSDACLWSAPDESATYVECDENQGPFLGEIADGEWYLVEIWWKGTAGFAHREDLILEG